MKAFESMIMPFCLYVITYESFRNNSHILKNYSGIILNLSWSGKFWNAYLLVLGAQIISSFI
jgi:hypothetical protein